MKISICITILNEERSIGPLLDSLLAQNKKPDEIIIVDAGSSDKTIQIINHYQKKIRKIKLLKETGTIAHGRNTAIEMARGEIIVMVDAGCVAKLKWLDAITQPFGHVGVGLVAGFYEMPAKNRIQKAATVYLGVPPGRFDPLKFLPSTRSVAFRKRIWEDLGGFNEKLQKGGEDTEFFYRCVKNGVKMVRVEEARVIWREVGEFSYRDILNKFYTYAKGDWQAKIWLHPIQALASHNIKISLIFARYTLAAALIILFIGGAFGALYLYFLAFLYLYWPIWKWRDVIIDWDVRLCLPVIQISSDIAVMAGFIGGIFSK